MHYKYMEIIQKEAFKAVFYNYLSKGHLNSRVCVGGGGVPKIGADVGLYCTLLIRFYSKKKKKTKKMHSYIIWAILNELTFGAKIRLT